MRVNDSIFSYKKLNLEVKEPKEEFRLSFFLIFKQKFIIDHSKRLDLKHLQDEALKELNQNRQIKIQLSELDFEFNQLEDDKLLVLATNCGATSTLVVKYDCDAFRVGQSNLI